MRQKITRSVALAEASKDDGRISEEEFNGRIDEARKSIAEGKGTRVSGKEELDKLLEEL